MENLRIQEFDEENIAIAYDTANIAIDSESYVNQNPMRKQSFKEMVQYGLANRLLDIDGKSLKAVLNNDENVLTDTSKFLCFQKTDTKEIFIRSIDNVIPTSLIDKKILSETQGLIYSDGLDLKSAGEIYPFPTQVISSQDGQILSTLGGKVVLSEAISTENKYARVVYRQNIGVDGGSTVANIWQKIPLNNEVANTIGLILNTDNTFTLPKGNYYFTINTAITDSGNAKLRLRQITTNEIITSSIDITSTNEINVLTNLVGFRNNIDFMSTEETYVLELWTSIAKDSSGLGTAINIPNEDEIYASLNIFSLDNFAILSGIDFLNAILTFNNNQVNQINNKLGVIRLEPISPPTSLNLNDYFKEDIIFDTTFSALNLTGDVPIEILDINNIFIKKAIVDATLSNQVKVRLTFDGAKQTLMLNFTTGGVIYWERIEGGSWRYNIRQDFQYKSPPFIFAGTGAKINIDFRLSNNQLSCLAYSDGIFNTLNQTLTSTNQFQMPGFQRVFFPYYENPNASTIVVINYTPSNGRFQISGSVTSNGDILQGISNII